MANDCASFRGTSIAKLKQFWRSAVEDFNRHSMRKLAGVLRKLGQAGSRVECPIKHAAAVSVESVWPLAVRDGCTPSGHSWKFAKAVNIELDIPSGISIAGSLAAALIERKRGGRGLGCPFPH